MNGMQISRSDGELASKEPAATEIKTITRHLIARSQIQVLQSSAVNRFSAEVLAEVHARRLNSQSKVEVG